jgi:predicted acyl esterase
MRPKAIFSILAVVSLLAMVFAGCLQSLDEADGGPEAQLERYTPVAQRHLLDYETGGQWSKTLEPGPYSVLPAEEFFVEFDLPLGHGAPTAEMNIGVFMPNVPEGTKVPVVADIGPYYGQLLYDPPVTEPANRLGGFLIETLVQHGFAVAQVAVPGTGQSSGCMDLMGPVEQAGIEAAIDFLGQAEWSNGNVGLIGRSYDGATAWQGAMNGNPHVKTIAPISGLWGMHELMWRNGSAETRAPGVLWGLYYSFPLTPHQDHMDDGFAVRLGHQAICRDAYAGLANAAAAYFTADQVIPELNPYWTDRSFRDRLLANYEGSVYLIHGMQDWNTDPHMAFPIYQELEANGLEMKGLFGQWAHHYPDRPGEHVHVRWDWAQDLLEWFTYYLKEEGPQPELHVEMQDDAGRWRLEETWPPQDVQWTSVEFGDARMDGLGCALDMVSPSCGLRVELGSMDEETLITGLPRLHLSVTPTGPGGQLYAELRDVTENRRIGHAIMDLRLHAGGWETQPVVPGQTIVAKMEFFPFDAVVPEGHELELVLRNTGRDYLPSVVSSPVMIDFDASSFRLPVIERGEDAYFTPPS